MKNEFDILNKVGKVEASPYLYIRIMQAVQNAQQKRVTLKLKVSWAAVALVLLVFNIITFTSAEKKLANSQAQTFTENAYGNVVNDIYHD